MKRSLTLAACLCLTSLASAQLSLEDFDSGTWPPVGWTVTDNIGNGSVWNTSSYYPQGNLSGGMGECAAMDADVLGTGQRTDTELITPAFDISGNHYYLEFDHHFQVWATDIGTVDISVGGGPWTNLKTVAFDITEHAEIYLDAYAGSTNCQLRFRYDDRGSWGYWWHVDNVEVFQGDPPPVPVWEEHFDSGTWPPVGWTVIDNIGNGNVWNTSSFWGIGNAAGGTGEAAAINDDILGSGQRTDTELITSAFDIPSGPYYLEFNNNFLNYDYAGVGDVDISVGGGPWVALKSYTTDSGGRASISLDDYDGSTGCQLRFRFDDLGYWAYWWYIDDVVVVEGDPPPTPIWEEDFDGGVFPPVGWTVIDNVGNGNVWNLSSTWSKGNLSGGTGEAAAIDDDEIGSGNETDTELHTPAFDVPNSGLLFMYTHIFYQPWVNEEGRLDISVDGGPWTNLITYTNASTGRVEIDMDPYAGSNVQIRFHYDDLNDWGYYWHVDDVGLYNPNVSPGIPYCFGDGSGAPCPCGNDNDGTLPEAGCGNGQYTSGARLSASGLASLSADTLVLHGENTEHNQSGLYFQADNDLSPGSIWGDGLRCAGGQLKRLGVRFSDGTGYSDTSVWATSISDKAGNITAGDTKYYQLWYRNPYQSPCATEFNTSNGVAISWAP